MINIKSSIDEEEFIKIIDRLFIYFIVIVPICTVTYISTKAHPGLSPAAYIFQGPLNK